jgi:hypothetical protein
MNTCMPVRVVVAVGSAALVAGFAPGRAAARDAPVDRAVDALIEVLGDPKAGDGDRVDETNRAIRALTAIGRPAVPKLIDAVLGTNNNAYLYGGLALKQMSQNESRDTVRERWDRLGGADRWRLAPYVTDVHFDAIATFALDSLKHKDEAIRIPAWSFIIKHRGAQRLAPGKEPFLRALAGGESPRVRWHLLTDAPVFDADKEADILIGLLRPDSWAAKGEGRVYPPGGTPPWWPDGREVVVPILGTRKVKRAAPALITVLAEKGPGRGYLGHLVIPILGDLGDQEAVPELKRVLGTPSDKQEPTLWGRDYLHVLAAAALMQLGDPAGPAGAKELLGSKEALAGEQAALAFAHHGTKDDLDTLGKLLDHESWQVRRDVCRGLERITGVVNRPPGWSVTTEDAAPLWKEWLRKNRKD